MFIPRKKKLLDCMPKNPFDIYDFIALKNCRRKKTLNTQRT